MKTPATGAPDNGQTGVRIADTLRQATTALQAVSDTARLDAELIMAHALGVDRAALLLYRMADPVPEAFAALLARRLAHEPVAYITGRKAFWNFELSVSPAVLIPRPDSETLIEAAITNFTGKPAPRRILDLGTGSGALLLAALDHWPDASGVGMDASRDAITVARANARSLDLRSRCQFIQADWRTTGWQEQLGGPFDLILANPPYVAADAALSLTVAAHEPHSALFAGPDGLDDYRLLIPALDDLLAAGGLVVFEIGHDQRLSVSALAEHSGFAADCVADLAGQDRAIVLRRSADRP